MLSRLGCRATAVAARAAVLQENVAVLTVVPVRTDMSHARNVPIAENLKNWEEAHKMFNDPERDHENYPTVKMQECVPPVRHGFIPEKYFDFFYEKTGVTGAYMLPLTVGLTLLSKEIAVMEHNLIEAPIFLLIMRFIGNKFGDKIANALNKKSDERADEVFMKPIVESKEKAAAFIAEGEQYLDQLTGKQHMYAAFRENVDLQLEEAYRKRLTEVHGEVEKRLNYQASVDNAKRQFEHEHMTKWIIDNAVKGITPQQEKESISKCILDLKALAAKA